MTRLGLLAVLAAALLGCATPQRPVEENNTPQPVRKEDIYREYSVPMEKLVKTCIAACKDVGADYCKPHVRIDTSLSSIVVCSRTRAYALLLMPSDDHIHIGVLLEIKDRATPGSKAPYDELWAALEARL